MSRSRLYFTSKGKTEINPVLVLRANEQLLETPFLGATESADRLPMNRALLFGKAPKIIICQSGASALIGAASAYLVSSGGCQPIVVRLMVDGDFAAV